MWQIAFRGIHALHEFHWHEQRMSLSCSSRMHSPEHVMHGVYSHACMYAFMQGSCSSEPSASALRLSGRDLAPRSPGQCVLVTDQLLMRLDHQNLWLDSLYIRYRVSDHIHTCCGTDMLHVSGTGTAHLWLTSVTLQGELNQVDKLSPSDSPGAIDVYGAQLYAEGGDRLSPFTRLRNA
jgi:hypothetical protein